MVTFIAFVGLPLAIANAACDANLFPVYAGGSQKEFTNCFAHDKDNDFLIVGGNTTSGDFGPY